MLRSARTRARVPYTCSTETWTLAPDENDISASATESELAIKVRVHR